MESILIDQMVSYVFCRAIRLDEHRLRKFLEWLKSHSSAIRNAEHKRSEVESWKKENINNYLKNSLKIWFESLPIPGLLWEYHLILGEINWWRDLDEQSLVRILQADDRD